VETHLRPDNPSSACGESRIIQKAPSLRRSTTQVHSYIDIGASKPIAPGARWSDPFGSLQFVLQVHSATRSLLAARITLRMFAFSSGVIRRGASLMRYLYPWPPLWRSTAYPSHIPDPIGPLTEIYLPPSPVPVTDHLHRGGVGGPDGECPPPPARAHSCRASSVSRECVPLAKQVEFILDLVTRVAWFSLHRAHLILAGHHSALMGRIRSPRVGIACGHTVAAAHPQLEGDVDESEVICMESPRFAVDGGCPGFPQPPHRPS